MSENAIRSVGSPEKTPQFMQTPTGSPRARRVRQTSHTPLLPNDATTTTMSPDAGQLITPPRGRLLYPADVRREIFRDKRSVKWIRRNVAPSKKLRLGHSTVAWWELDVLEWIDSQVEVA